MKRGRSEAETCRLNGWSVGTVVRGHEQWRSGGGVWTTWRITAIGDVMVLARTIKSERTIAGVVDSTDDEVGREHSVTFTCREWSEVPP